MNPADIAATGAAAAGLAPGAEITLWSMFWSAHVVVKIVMIGLLAASVWCWAIVINKVLLLRRTQKAMDQFEEVFWSGSSLDELYQTLSQRPTSGTASLFVAAMREWRRSLQSGAAASFMGLQARIEKVLDVSIAREVEKLESNLLVLATVASASPFIGLFGTVWGIMTSFRSIAASRNTSLAVVAPGIAEALFATAIGLFAAIPALIAYNKLQGDVAKKQARLEGFADEFSSILSRQIDQRAAHHDQAA
ncbi:protein TolQ [Methylocella sp.]|uniref:protein TolQ n=1 Tax=Methylocella sp. TaxID=1978226 RepID=UPI003783C14B